MITAAGAAALPFGLPPAHAAAGAYALLVGNTTYNPADENLPPALKCVRDLETKLKRFGFEVTTLHDASIAQVQAELDKLQRNVAAAPANAGVFYFVGHGFQSNADNYLVPAGGDLQSSADQLARTCLSLERDVFARLKRGEGPAATVIMVDACRTPDRPRSPTEGYNQTLPPEGCHVAFATGPGKRAFAPADPQRYTLFAEALVAELDATEASGSVLLSLENVRARVSRKVNAIPAIVKAFGPNAQEPELASHVSGDPIWIVGAASSKPAPAEPASAATAAGSAASDAAPDGLSSADATAELERIRRLPSPEDAAERLKALVAKLPDGALADLARLRLRDLDKVLEAARTARLSLDLDALQRGQSARFAEDVARGLRGDKYAAMRVAEALRRPAGSELIERTDHGRWMIFSAYLGNGIAAYRLSEHYRSVDRRDVEASRFLALARANQYTPPRQLNQGR
ncbi:MAG: caspase family protein [Burkholderiaceae bacterium]